MASDGVLRDSRARSETELEHTVTALRAQELHREACKQARQRAFLREERKKVRENTYLIETDTTLLKQVDMWDWFPSDYLPESPGSRLRLNVGGQTFEVGQQFLKKDPESLLAALTSKKFPLRADDAIPPLIAYVDRDWWIFRCVLTFLRDGILPRSRRLVLQLYKEAAFWRLDTLTIAIEETHLNLRRSKIDIRTSLGSNNFGDIVVAPNGRSTKFWLRCPNWWESPATSRNSKNTTPPNWWRDDENWKGAKFGPLSTDPGKVIASKEDVKSKSDVMPMLSSTWGYTS